jgi:hypothetical protein
MRHDSRVTSLSWIPSEAVTGGARLAFDAGFTHYDEPPPGELGDIERLRAADRFRFANVLQAWIDVDDFGQVTGSGYSGGGLMGSAMVKLGALRHRFVAIKLPDLQRDPQIGGGWVRFVQTTGGRTGLPAPRRVRRRPYVQWQAPLVWTTLSLTLHTDGRAEGALAGASRFPRHWVYDGNGQLSHKSGLTDFGDWYRKSFGRHSPWGDEDSPALVTAVETALERSLSAQLMGGPGRPRLRQVKAGEVLVRQGEPGTSIYLVLDGVIRVDRDGERLAEYGPGAPAGRACVLGRRGQNLNADRRYPEQGSLGRGQPVRPVRFDGAIPWAPARRRPLRLRRTSTLAAPGLDPSARHGHAPGPRRGQ